MNLELFHNYGYLLNSYELTVGVFQYVVRSSLC